MPVYVIWENWACKGLELMFNKVWDTWILCLDCSVWNVSMFIPPNVQCILSWMSPRADAGQPVARGGSRRRRWFRCRLRPRSWLHPLVLHGSVPPSPQQPAGLHGHAGVPQPPPPPPPCASPSGHQRPLFTPQLPRRPRAAFHRGARERLQADGPCGAADESQRARKHPLLAYMTTTVPAPHYMHWLSQSILHSWPPMYTHLSIWLK